MRLLFGWIKTWFVLWGRVKPGPFIFSARFNVDLFSLNLTSPSSKIFLGIISSVVKFGFKTFYWGLDFPLSLQSIRSALSVRWIQVYPWFFWLVMKKHQVYVTIKLPPRSKPNRGMDPPHTNSLRDNAVWWLARIYQNTSENVSCLGCIL